MTAYLIWQGRSALSRGDAEPELKGRPESLSVGKEYLLRISAGHGAGSRWEKVIFLAYSADPGLSVVDRDGRREVVSRRNLFQAGSMSIP